AVTDGSRALVRRSRALALTGAVGWALAAGVATASAIVAAIVGSLIVAWRWRRTSHAAIVQAVERADPASRNVFVTADELIAGRLAASDRMTARGLADGAGGARRGSPRAGGPNAPAAAGVAAGGG